MAGLDLCKHFVAVNEFSGAVFKALQPLFDDGIHFLVGVGTRWNGLFFAPQTLSVRLLSVPQAPLK